MKQAAQNPASDNQNQEDFKCAQEDEEFDEGNEIRRTKERQIKFVVERVSLWRKLYNGVDMGNGETVRYSLEDAANLVGISKKSLDDYLLQLRFGRMFGFNFIKY